MGNKSRKRHRPKPHGTPAKRELRRISHRGKRRMGPLHLAMIGALAGVVFTIVFAGIMGPDPFESARRSVLDRVRILLESEEETIVREYMDSIVTQSNIWHGTPAVFQESETYFREHFSALDPRVPHDFDELPKPAKTMYPSDLVPRVNLFTAEHIGLVGIVSAEPRQAAPAVWNLQIQWPRRDGSNSNRSTVYVRVTAFPDESYEEGDVVAVNGVALATGEVSALSAPGFLDAVFLAGSAIAKFPPDEFNQCIRETAKTSGKDLSPCFAKRRD
jgi:hypothetical protein